MILSDLRTYLRQRGQASLRDLALHFRSEPEALRGMLDLLERRGQVRKVRAHAACGEGCSQCDPATTEIYLWGESIQAQPLVRDLGCPGG